MNVYYEFHTGGRAINHTAFKTAADYTEEMRRQIRRAANHQCQQCKGEGVYGIGTAEMKLCRCVGVY